MREFTIRPGIQDFELNLIEEIFSKEMLPIVKAYLKKYAGTAIEECLFRSKNNMEWNIQQFNSFSDMYNLSKEFLESGWRKMLPFGYDPGGWHFCLCMEDDSYGAIFINRWTDHASEEQFLKIADSFEEFINGLEKDPEEV
jgi:hypothetical protein